jgi:hypothetical protein
LIACPHVFSKMIFLDKKTAFESAICFSNLSSEIEFWSPVVFDCSFEQDTVCFHFSKTETWRLSESPALDRIERCP